MNSISFGDNFVHPFFRLLSVEIPSYGVFMAAGLLFASLLAVIRVRRAGGDSNDAIIIICCAIGGALLGSFLLYLVASYGLDRVLEDIKNGNYSFFTSGGMVFYGGVIGGVAGAFLGKHITHETRNSMLVNAFVPCIPFGHAIGRVGCLFGGCCYGLPYDGIGAVHLDPVGITYPVFPIQLLEAAINLILSGCLLLYSRKKPYGYTLLYLYLVFYGAIRFILEFFRGDMIRGVYNGLSTSQWISVLLVLLGIMLLIYIHTHKKVEVSK